MGETSRLDPTKEPGYFARRSGLYMAGKGAAESLGDAFPAGGAEGLSVGGVEATAMAESSSMLSATSGVFNGIGGMITIGLAAAVSAALTQMDYHHKRGILKDTYKEELAVKLRKPLHHVVAKDLDVLAKNNSVVNEELASIRKQRNFGVALSFVATMVALTVAKVVLPMAVGYYMDIPAHVAAEEVLKTWGGFAAKVGLAFLTYNAVKAPLHWVTDKLFGVDDRTAHDVIVSIKRDRALGKAITREQVAAVFVATHPELEQAIVSEHGKNFDDLHDHKQKQIAHELSNVLPLDKLALDINSGAINVTELAFAVEGKTSGIEKRSKPAPEPKNPGMLKTMWNGVTSTLGFTTTSTTINDDVKLTVSASAQAEVIPVEAPSEPAAKPFVERLGLTKANVALSHVERLDQQSRSEPGTPVLRQS